MDWQAAFNGLLGIALTTVGVIYKMLTERVKGIEEDLKRFPSIYARRDDVKDGFDRIENTLERIENKLDNKADKH